jgi:hypothetical protein
MLAAEIFVSASVFRPETNVGRQRHIDTTSER